MSNLTDDILGNIDIVDVVSRYVNLRRIGRNFSGLCPFHNEKTPSFTVAQDKQIYKCFGCGAGGNAIKFVMEIEKIDFWDAIKILAKDANVELSKYKFDDAKHEKSVNDKEKLKLLNKHALNFFSDNLKSSTIAIDYLHSKRKIEENIIEKFSIGYAPDSHYELVKFLKSKGFDENDIIQAGLGSKGSTSDIYSFFRNRIIFPIWDHMGNIVSFAGRSLNPEDMPKYLNITQTPLYDKSNVLYGLNIARNHIKEFNKIVVVEGYMDVIALYRANFPVGVATCGTALTPSHMKILKRYTQNVTFAFDNDEAGFSAVTRGLKVAYENGIFPNVLIIKDGKDLDELVNSGATIDINEEVEGMDFILEKFKTRYNLNSPTDRKNMIDTLFDIVSSIQDYSVIMFYLEKICRVLSLNFDVLFRQFKTFLANKKTFAPKETKQETALDDKYYLLSIFYGDFIKTNEIDTDEMRLIIDTLKSVICYTDTTLFTKVLENNIEGEEKQKILEAQLRWEKQFESAKNQKKQDIVGAFLRQQIHKFSQFVVKLSTISFEEKNILLENLRKITKK